MSCLKLEKTTIAFREAVRLYSDRHNDKTLDQLLRNFNVPQVAKLIRLFSNEKIHIPDEKKIWLAYRNKRIRDELDTINPDDKSAIKQKKQELATLFEILPGRVDAVYSEEKAKFPGNFDDINKIAYQIYKEEFIHFKKEIENLLGAEPFIETKKRPPIIPY